MGRLRRVFDIQLFNGTGVDMRPANGAHVALLPGGTTAVRSTPSTAADYHFFRLRHKAKRMHLVMGGKVASVTLGEVIATDDVQWNTPIYVYGFSTPYYDPAVDYWSQHYAVQQVLDIGNGAARILDYGSSPLAGIAHSTNGNAHQSMGIGFTHSPSQPPRLQPGVARGTADQSGGETTDMPGIGDYVGGQMLLGNALEGSAPPTETENQAPRGHLDAESIDGMWLFLKCVWPANTILDYTAAAYTLDLDIRLIGLG